MKVIKLLPILLGGAGVIQAGLNKTIAQTNGLCMAGLINGAMGGLCLGVSSGNRRSVFLCR